MIGAPRAGKDVVASFLQETRNFASFAFADRVKEEFGISKEDFEAAKIAGNIKELRDKLWAFSAEKKKDDPEYFIRLVMERAISTEESVVITDIRTEDEFLALFKYSPANTLPRIYMVQANGEKSFENDMLLESKLSRDFLFKHKKHIRPVYNFKDKEGVYAFYKRLENVYFTEDIMDLPQAQDDYDSKNYNTKYKSIVSNYVSQFQIRQK